MVVAVTNELEMTSLQAKAFTVINKTEAKIKMKKEAAKVIGKSARLFLKLKNKDKIKSKEVFELDKIIGNFKIKRR